MQLMPETILNCTIRYKTNWHVLLFKAIKAWVIANMPTNYYSNSICVNVSICQMFWGTNYLGENKKKIKTIKITYLIIIINITESMRIRIQKF